MTGVKTSDSQLRRDVKAAKETFTINAANLRAFVVSDNVVDGELYRYYRGQWEAFDRAAAILNMCVGDTE